MVAATSSAQDGEARLALAAGVGCYVIWGLVPLAFQVIGRLGVGPIEFVAHRALWSVPTVLLFVWMARQGAQVRRVLTEPRTLMWLMASTVLIAMNWTVFIWAVNSGRLLETSLGYYINPLLNMAAGALLFRERLSRTGWIAIGLAAIGVALQAVALGQLPWVSLFLGATFCGYGIVRKRVPADAQTGLFIESLFLALPGIAILAWFEAQGTSHGFKDPTTFLWLLACGPMTAVPLVLFSWAARRAPLSLMGFLQFIAPTMTFVMGVMQGEPFTFLRGVSFVFIWSGAAMFAYGAWRRSRMANREALAPAQ
jgi:chloramphenicol-sensitive protein RarD